jgi:hypothetical protein
MESSITFITNGAAVRLSLKKDFAGMQKNMLTFFFVVWK